MSIGLTRRGHAIYRQGIIMRHQLAIGRVIIDDGTPVSSALGPGLVVPGRARRRWLA